LKSARFSEAPLIVIRFCSKSGLWIADSALAMRADAVIVPPPRIGDSECHCARKGKESMTAKWGSCIFLAVLLALMAGCRTPQPNLKPDKTPEKLVAPPEGEARYETPGYPKQAFDAPTDPTKQTIDAKNAGSGRNMSAGGMGGLPGR
jgi:hypothetical protein